MVWRRRDQADAGGGMTDPGDPVVDLVTGQLPPLAGLGTLRHLDLKRVGVDQIFGGDAETAGGDLLNRRANGVAIFQRLIADRIFAALTGIGLGTQPVHGGGQRRVGFPGDRAEGHRTRGHPLDDFAGRLHLVQGQGLGGKSKFKQAAQVAEMIALIVHHLAVLLGSSLGCTA